MNNAEKGAAFGPRRLLRIPNYRRLWLAQAVSDFGDNLTTLTLVLLVNKLTGSTAALGLLLIVLAVPQATFGLLAGVYADRHDRRRIMLVSDGLRGVLLLALAALTLTSQVWLFYVIAFVQASIGTFFSPARGALLPKAVPPEGLLTANSLGQISRVVTLPLGGGAAGLLVGMTGLYWPAFVIDAATFFFSCLLVSRVRLADTRPEPAEESVTAGRWQAVFSELLAGLTLIKRSRLLLASFLGIGITMLGLGAVNVLLTPLVINDLHIPTTLLGLVDLSQASSMLLSGLVLAVIAARFKPALLMSLGLVGLGICTFCFALAGDMWQLMAILFVAGWLITPIQTASITLVQHTTGDQTRGRVLAAFQTVISITQLISMGLAGTLGDLIGARLVLVLAGGLGLLSGLVALGLTRGQGSGVRGQELETRDQAGVSGQEVGVRG